jgi:hypothetical protein
MPDRPGGGGPSVVVIAPVGREAGSGFAMPSGVVADAGPDC